MSVRPKTKKRKVCFVITNRVHYARQKLLLQRLKDHPALELQLVVGGSALLQKHSNTVSQIEENGFQINEKLYMVIEGGDNVAMAKTTGMAILEFTNTFQKLDPDVVIIRGDRYEMLAAATAAAYLNKTIAHIEGGELSGTIDESVRHAITKLSHIHFVTNQEAYRRVVQMGEDPGYVFMVGSTDVEHAAHFTRNGVRKNFWEQLNRRGTGPTLDFSKGYLTVMYHPVTTEPGQDRVVEKLLRLISNLQRPTVWFWPNIDAGTDEVSKTIRKFRESHNPATIRFIRDMPPEDFSILLKKTSCLIGNSSAGIKECSYFGVPVVNIGTRQTGRLRATNVVDVGYQSQPIKNAIEQQLIAGRYPVSTIYCQPQVSKTIADILGRVDLYVQKNFKDTK